MAVTELGGRRELKYVRAPIPEEARGFSRVVVEVAVSEGFKDLLNLYLYRDGERLLDPKVQEVVASEQLQLVTFSVPSVLREQLVPDEVGVALRGKCDLGAIASISFVNAPLSTFVPPAGGRGVVERIETHGLRSFGLIAGQALEAECSVDERTTIEMSLGLLPEMSSEGAEVDVLIEAISRNGTKNRTVQVGYGSWHPVVLAGDWLGSGDVRVRVTTEKDVRAGSTAVLVGAPCARRIDPPGASSRPEDMVLLITSDTHRADHIGIVAPEGFVSTPSLDGLAREGILFTDCSSQTNVTLPSHITLLTGIHARDTGILSNSEKLASSVTTLAEVFAEAGYETSAATSVPHVGPGRSGVDQGFDRFDGPISGYRDGSVAVDKVVDWVSNTADGPKFIWLHVFDAHAPYSPPEGFDRKYWTGGDPFEGERTTALGIGLPKWLKGLKQFDFPATQYRGEVDYLDGALGRVLGLPQVREGVVAFTSDHGESLGEHGLWWSHSTLRPSVTQIPLIMSWPGGPQGVRLDAPVRQMDVGRTLLARCGIESDFGGVDLAKALDGGAPSSPRFLISAHHNSAAIKHEGWLYLQLLRPHKTAAHEEAEVLGQAHLYQLSVDPTAKKDLLLEELERASQMRTALLNWLDSAPTEKLVEAQMLSEAQQLELVQLGYSGDDTKSGQRYWSPESYGAAEWQASPWRRLFEDDEFTVKDFRRAIK